MNTEKKLNKIIIISSPYGAGKTTICKELLKNNQVVFAGAIKPHPLVNNFKVKVETKKGDPMTQIIASGNNAIEVSNEILEKFTKSLKK